MTLAHTQPCIGCTFKHLAALITCLVGDVVMLISLLLCYIFVGETVIKKTVRGFAVVQC